MASASKSKYGPVIRWYFNDRPQTLRVGGLTMRQAESMAMHISDLVAARRAGIVIAPATQAWLSTLPVETRRRLAGCGLIEIGGDDVPSVSRSARMKDYLDAIVDGKEGVNKETTQSYARHTISLIMQAFPGNPRLSELRGTAAEDFRQWMQKRGDLAEATMRKHSSRARMFFRRAVKAGVLTANPFEDASVPTASIGNKSRQARITREDALRIMDALPDAQWRLLFALARWGGFRIPSEAEALRWSHIDWVGQRITVPVPKLEHIPGKDTRVVPLFPEINAALLEWREKAPEGNERVLPMAATWIEKGGGNTLRYPLENAILRCGLKVWPRLWNNLRSTRVTELKDQFPAHVVDAWMGHSQAISDAHYGQVWDDHFRAAANVLTNTDKSAHTCAHVQPRQTPPDAAKACP